jgi:hypothetical protein
MRRSERELQDERERAGEERDRVRNPREPLPPEPYFDPSRHAPRLLLRGAV